MKLHSSVLDQLARAFSGADLEYAVKRLEGTSYPMAGSAESLGRIQHGVILLSGKSVEKFEQALEFAKTDWRDVLAGSGLGNEDWRDVLRRKGIDFDVKSPPRASSVKPRGTVTRGLMTHERGAVILRRRMIVWIAMVVFILIGALMRLTSPPPETPKPKSAPRAAVLSGGPRAFRTDGELAEEALRRSNRPKITREDIERWWVRVGKTPDTMALGARLLEDPDLLPPRPPDGIEDPRLILARYAFALKDSQSPEKRDPALRELASLADSFRASDPDNLRGFLLSAQVRFLSEGFVAAMNSLTTDLPDNDQDYSDEARKLTQDFLTRELALSPVDAFLQSGQTYGPGDPLSACIARGSRHFEQYRTAQPPPELARQAASLLRVMEARDTLSGIRDRLSMVSSEAILLMTFPPDLPIERYLSTTLAEYREGNAAEKNRLESHSAAIRRVLLDGNGGDQELLLGTIEERGEVQAAGALFGAGGPLAGYLPERNQ